MSLFWTFLVGGAICAVGQILIDKTKLTPARILVLFVLLGVVLTGAGVYDAVVDFAGAGATTPIVGFGYALAKGVREAVATRGALGILIGGMQSTAPGVALVICLAFVIGLVTRSGDKP